MKEFNSIFYENTILDDGTILEGANWDSTKGAHIYNEQWKDFWDRNSSPTQSEVFDYAKILMKEIYGTDVF